jgi:hypothetical protein
VILVRGKEGWRIAGAVPEEQWFPRLSSYSSRERLSRVSGLLLRLVAGETPDERLFNIMRGYIEALARLPEDTHEASEVLVVLRLLEALGLDTGEIPGEISVFTPELLSQIELDRKSYVARINMGIVASGL